MRRLTLLTLLILTAPAAASAQIEECLHFKENIDRLARGEKPEAGPGYEVALLDVGAGARCFAAFLAVDGNDPAPSLFADFVRRFEGSRTDKQSGTSASSTGSTSVVSQGAAARVLSVAAEYGALTQSVSGQVVTVRGNLAGVPSALIRHNVFPYCVAGDASASAYCVQDSTLSLLRRVSFSASFDTSRSTDVTGTPAAAGGDATSGGAQPVTFTARRHQISAWSARIELWNRRDTTSKKFLDTWRARVGGAIDQAGQDLLDRAGDFTDAVTGAPAYDAWQKRHIARIRAQGRDRAAIVAALHDALQELTPIAQAAAPALSARAQAALASYSRFFLAQDELIDAIATEKVFAVEFTNNRPAGQAATSNVRFIADWPLSATTKVVANGAVTFYDTSPAGADAGADRYRDAQFALQLDHGVEAAIIGPATFSAALYYQYQHSPAMLEVDPANPIPGVTFSGLPEGAKTVFANKGDIVLGQLKLTFAPQGSNVKVPVALTYSNRTELIDKPTWRGQVGLAYDLDSLFALARR